MKTLTDETSIPEILKEFSLEEKVNFLTTVTACISREDKDRDIPSLVLEDGATGVNGTHIILDFLALHQDEHSGDLMKSMGDLTGIIAGEETEKAPITEEFQEYLKTRCNPEGKFISFPSGINIGACFDTETAREIGRAVGEEHRFSGSDVCLGPNVDLMRDPLGGRNYEMYGEDPVLVERTAAAFIQGLQSEGVMACAKHFIANNQETNRQTKNTHVSTRTLKELYARGFRAAVTDGGCRAVMSAYNAVNGTFSSYNQVILTDWLKKEWGFEGMVVSDWGAVTGHYDQSVKAGMDLILHGGRPSGDVKEIRQAVENGELSEERVDDALTGILRNILWEKKTRASLSGKYSQEKLLETAFRTNVEGMVLLKNEDVLPLQENTAVSFAGSRSSTTMECGSGSTFVNTPLHGSLREECRKAGITETELNASKVLIYAAGAEGGENADRPSMALDREDEEKIEEVLRSAKEAGKKTVVVLNIAGPVDMRKWLPYADAILCEFVPGCTGAAATAAVLTGKESPNGRLPLTFPCKLADSPAFPYSLGEYNDVFYSEGIFTGYRWYEAREIPVQFPFGFGLSYTGFSCRVLSRPPVWDLEEEPLWKATVEVENTGHRPGAQVVQLYLGQENPRIPMPQKELMAYAKVHLEPGEKREVTLTVDKRDLEVFDPAKGALLIPVGKYALTLGTSAAESFYTGEVEIRGKNPYVMDENTTLGEILESEAAMKAVGSIMPQIFSIPKDTLKMVASEKIGTLLSRVLIQQIPDANKVKGILDELYRRLAEATK